MSRALPRYQAHEQRELAIAAVATALLKADVAEPISAGGLVAPGEALTLRCIHVCTRGVAAVIPGTQPLAEVIHLENQRERLRSSAGPAILGAS